MSTQYKVFITPLESRSVYGTEIEITDHVIDGGVSAIRRGIDSTDYGFGAFFFDDIQIKCLNLQGVLNDESDVRSIFKYSRDVAKVRVVYSDSNGDTITFRGLINEEATKLDATKDEITFRILSRDSVLRNTQVSGGSISAGNTVSQAIIAILNQSNITAVLNFDPLNINPDLNFIIDDGSALENKSVKEALNSLLLTSNSTILIDEDDNIIVRNRDHNEDRDIINLYGPYDIHRRQNIIDIKNYNTGKQRMFTAVKVNDSEETNSGYQTQFGYRQKTIQADYITTESTERDIGANLVEQFKTPKIELEVVVPTHVIRDAQIFDVVSINHPLRLEPIPDTFFPIVGQAEIGDAMTPLPYSFGSVSIVDTMGFKIIEIKEDVKNFNTTLKLRQIGTEFGDGYFTSSTCGIIGFAVIETSTICLEGDPADAFNPSVLGAAVIGYTEVA